MSSSPVVTTSAHRAADVVRTGGLVAYPTDTVYGLGCDPFNQNAVERLFQAKGREAKPIPVLCDSFESAKRLVLLEGAALKLAVRHWPGPLTIVVRKRLDVAPQVDQRSGEVGVRVPNSVLCLNFIALCGGLVTGTSANRSGTPSCRDASEVQKALGGSIDLILDGGRTAGTESTVVRVIGESVEILRRGAIADEGLV